MQVPRDDRAVSPVVGKALEAALVVLYLGLVTTTLYGGVVPDYRATAGAEVGDRTLAAAATELERAVPPPAESVVVEVRVDLPRTIAGDRYAVRADAEALVLDHPDPAVGGRTPLSLPDHVVGVRGAWESTADPVVSVRSVEAGVEVVLA
ncbi:hypothetical protein N0B31_20090 [Salinirubellus salinus]|uniref:Uncharacterized protein n=1 Tax=Salinirubellus salinus TaxID=1364945 RepID=A0A9E7U872_9EURY|nr:hypothetical protein [Salinirubellus salinus]UWM54406.1 hypothetical protein N0B31_20090 [Salinirubellus salinus]